jgi:RHS repeat-associated protein
MNRIAFLGLVYNYFRDYDPSIGRYIESDPIGLEGGINTYAYVEGNPLKFIDFLGLSNCYFTAEGHRVCKGPDLDPQPNRCPSGDCAVYPSQVPGIDQQTDLRPIPEIDCAMCELNCSIVSLGLPGPVIPYPKKEVAGWVGSQAGGWAMCKMACREKCKDDDCQK